MHPHIMSARLLRRRLRPGVLDEPKSSAPADQEYGEDATGHNGEGKLYAAAGEPSKRHPANDGAKPYSDPRPQQVRVPPGAPDECA